MRNVSKNNSGQKVGKDQESIQSNTTPDPRYTWESDNLTTRHHKREPNGQPPPSNRRPQGTNKQTRTKAQQKQDRNNINDPKNTVLERSVKKIHWGA